MKSTSPSLSHIEYLGKSYKSGLSLVERKKGGVFYTPESVAAEMTRECLEKINLNRALPPTVLDPSCGGGIFLVTTLRALLTHIQPQTTQEAEHLLTTCIFGVDRDPKAVELTKKCLRIELANWTQEKKLSPPTHLPLANNIRTGDSLLDWSQSDWNLDLSQHSSFRWKQAFSDLLRKDGGGFDLILGNPPYGLSRGEQLSPFENTWLKVHYEDVRVGKINKYILFLAQSLKLLKPKGHLAFLIPNAWLGIRSGKKIRKLLCENNLLEHLVIFEAALFDDPQVEAVVLFVSGKPQKSESFLLTRTPTSSWKRKTTQRIRYDLCTRDPECLIPTHWNSNVTDLFEHIQNSSAPLENFDFRPMIALQAYATGKGTPPQSKEDVKKHIYHSREKLGDDYYPYLQGKDVGRYTLCWSGDYLRYGPFLAEPQTRERFTGPRIILREITRATPHVLVATYTKKTYLYNKSILHILPQEKTTEQELLALLAILNSPLASFVLAFRGRKSQRKLFPKIVNRDLQTLPLPKTFDASVSGLSQGAKELLTPFKNENLREQKEHEVNALVYQAYELSPDQIRKLNLCLSESAI